MGHDNRTRPLDRAQLRKCRQERGWSQERLAEELRVSKKTIERWERGNPVFYRHIRQLEELFEVDLNIADPSASPITEAPETERAVPRDEDRALLIRNVRKIWIDGVLGQSLAAHRAISLDLEPQIDVVEHPWADVPMPQPYPTGLRAEASVQGAFCHFGRTLLILGAPGAGKTTLMLQLAAGLLDEAERDEHASVPVVFPLSSWIAPGHSLTDWLVNELNRRYEVASRTARDWVEHGVILPLLDGLDEIPSENRETCVAVINDFRAGRRDDLGVVPLVVCCRTNAYAALSVRLMLNGAVIVHPLERERVESYLRQDEGDLAGAYAMLQADPTLWEIIDTPLMLGVLVQACRDRPPTSPPTGISRQERRAWLLDAYVNAMFERRGRAHPYTPTETLCWLIGLAALLRKSRQTILYLEWMQPNALPAGFLVNVAVLAPLLISGLTTGLLFGFGAQSVLDNEIAIWAGALLGVVGPVGFWQFGYGGEIKPVETLRWSWPSLISKWKERTFGAVLFGLCFGCFGWLVDSLGLGLILGALSAVLFFTCFEVPGRTSEARVVPNQGVRRSVISAIMTGIAAAAGFGLLLAAHLDPGAALAFGLGLGLVAALLNGGHTCIQHAILRLLLWQCGRVPLNYVRFLDFAAQLILLRKVGGGYMFIHALFQEHFARHLPDEAPIACSTDKTALCHDQAGCGSVAKASRNGGCTLKH
jgi:transcriptional regulator with XRE-family HTH domain